MQPEQIVEILALILALMVAIIGHEIMHGLAAYKYGDNTAKEKNRLSINPLVHIDPIGTIVVPALLYFSGAGFLFGWAKPVPINVNTVIKNGGYNGAIVVSLAGIAYNFTLAVIAAIVLNYLPQTNSLTTFFLESFITYMVVYNVVLGIFNLLPIPPLDGSHAVEYLLRKLKFFVVANYMQSFSKYGMILLIIIIATPLSSIIFTPIRYMINLLI